jgi:hypothetical protein
MDQMTHSRQTPAPDDATKLRIRGKRMLELATRAYGEQHPDFARLLTRLAAEVFAHAEDAEKSYVPYPARVDGSRRPIAHDGAMARR